MKLTILGCGTSTGVPVPGCGCAICTSNDPKNSRLRTSAIITTSDNKGILIDSSPDFRYQALRAKIKRIDGVLYTHEHADHTAGIDDLRGYCYLQGSKIPCFGSALTLSHLKKRFSYIFSPDPNYQGALLPQLELVEIRDFADFELAGLQITPFPLMHGKTPVTGFKIGNLAYATDCNFLSEETRKLLSGIDTLLITGLRYEEHRTHFTIPQAIEVSQQLGVRRCILIHMTHSVDFTRDSHNLPRGIEFAYDGMQVEWE